MSTRVPLVYGSGLIGISEEKGFTKIHTLEEAQAAIDIFVSHGHKEIDTSRVYGSGTTEEFLGKIDLKGALVDTKAFPRAPGDHSPEKLRASVEASVKALDPYKINIFYLHAPDRSVPFEDTLREVNELYKKGLFKEFGLSNFNSWEVAEFYYIAKSHGWVLPTVYQGIYNALQRSVETELIPCLRKFGIRFFAYSPLAYVVYCSPLSSEAHEYLSENSSGLLAGRIQSVEDMDKDSAGSRWNADHIGPRLREEHTPLLPIYKELKIVLEKHDITLSQAGLRWLQHHSLLGPTDAVIIGASNNTQLESNLKDSEGGPLPEEITQLIDQAWAKIKGGISHYAF